MLTCLLCHDVEIRNPFNPKKYNYDKLSILDIKATDEDGRIYDVEVQSFGDEFYANRSLYYRAKIYSDQLNESEPFDEAQGRPFGELRTGPGSVTFK